MVQGNSEVGLCAMCGPGEGPRVAILPLDRSGKGLSDAESGRECVSAKVGAESQFAARHSADPRSRSTPHGRQVEVSRVAARSSLSREIVDFFERDVAAVLYVLYSVVGALVMLGLADRMLTPCCLAILLAVCLLGRWNGRQSLTLNGKLNDQLEREVEVIQRARPREVRGHFDIISCRRIRLSDREAWAFSLIQVPAFGLLAMALARSCAAPSVDARQIVAVSGYVLLFVTGMINVPLLMQQFSRLRDIGRRLRSES
jgi:hypothetical protein